MSWEHCIDVIKEWVLSLGYATITYLELVKAQILQWVVDQNYLQTGFVDRGDPAFHDFVRVSFTTDGAWHTLDLSAIVPKGAKGVLLFCSILSTTTTAWLQFRRNGNVNEINTSYIRSPVAGIPAIEDLICPCSIDRKIQYFAPDVTYLYIFLTVKGWWL